MSLSFVIIGVLLFASYGFYSGRLKSLRTVNGDIRTLHSLPNYYGGYVALWCGLPALLLICVWVSVENSVILSLVLSGLGPIAENLTTSERSLLIVDIQNLASGNIASRTDAEIVAAANRYSSFQSISMMAMVVTALCVGIVALIITKQRIAPHFRARNRVEQIISFLLVICSLIAILTTIGIVLSLLFETIRFFGKVPFTEFLFGMEWSPQTALRADQVGSSGAFGAVPLFAGTLLIAFIAMCVATPIGLFSAIYMAEYADQRVRAVLKPLLEILAGIPTVVYGFFAAITVAPFIRGFGESIGLDVASESALAAGLVMGIMIIPFISSLADDVITAVPQSLREGSLGLGATKSETIKRVVFPAALPGIVGGILLAVSRAIGETMIVVMAAGLAANLTINPLEAVTTVTVQIVTLLVGDQEFDSAKTLAAFALGLVLFCVTLVINIVALKVVRRYREQYE
ncbi:MAG: phosphate ABC transporter permease subunit PstC [Rhodospirillaceae bacterium]